MADSNPPALELATIKMVVQMAGKSCMIDDCDGVVVVLVGIPTPGDYGFAPCCARCLLSNLNVFTVKPKR